MEEFKKFACLLAEESAKIIRQYFRHAFSIDKKSDDSPVTIADKKAEEVMRELIMKEFPEHGIVGEEEGEYKPEAEYKWVLDPIDGTLSFVCGSHLFGTLIALVKNDQPILGVIHQPILNELLIGDNRETIYNGSLVKVRSCRELSKSVMLTTDPYLIKQYQNLDAFEKLRKRVKVYRGIGDCYGYLLLAIGSVDIMIDPIMNPWDIMALLPVVRGADGTITDYHGGNPASGTSIIATGGDIHDQVVAILNTR